MSIFITIEQCEKSFYWWGEMWGEKDGGEKRKRADTIPDIIHKIYHQQRKLTKFT